MPPSQRRPLSDFSEFQLIQDIRRWLGRSRHASVLKGIGDDAALIRPHRRRNWLVSTDLLIEGIHFDPRRASFHDIGYRAAVANLSDIAAMGGIPRFLLVSLAIPARYSLLHLRTLYRGLLAPCKEHHVQVIGGDTSASRKGIFLSVTIIGTIEPNRTLYRRGAKVGDHVYATGTLGDSSAGLELVLSKTKKPQRHLGQGTSDYLIKRHLRPIPRLNIGRLLALNRLATAAIDLSDGLAGDLNHLCQESGVGALIEGTALPLSPQYRSFTRYMGRDPIQMALQGGEDYELLFTVPERHQQKLKRLINGQKVQITRIGTIQPRKLGIRLKVADGSDRIISERSYDHFRKEQDTSP